MIDKNICRIESDHHPVSDEYVNRLGKESLQLKDNLYQVIKLGSK